MSDIGALQTRVLLGPNEYERGVVTVARTPGERSVLLVVGAGLPDSVPRFMLHMTADEAAVLCALLGGV